jgi:undecaprenyl phosphate-alpha-L-ara4N flippase subunit ArnE
MNGWAVLTVILCVTMETIEQLCYKRVGHNPSFSKVFVVIAFISDAFKAASWFYLLTLLPLGVALPMMGINFVSISLTSKLIFKEKVDRWRWLGIVLIICGLCLIAGYQA